MRQETDPSDGVGWFALGLATLGFIVPASLYFYVNHLEMQADSLGWEEGVGFVAFLGVAAIVGLTEIVALVMGWLGTKSTVGKIAGAAAALGLALVLWVVVLATRR